MPTQLWLEDLAPGQVIETGSYRVEADEIIAFASQWDPQPFHTDPEAARDSSFGGLAASGWHTAAITMRLLVLEGMPTERGSVGAGIDLSWPTPTRPGDELRLVIRVVAVRRSRSKPDRGVVTLEYDTLTQADEVRQHTRATCLVWARTTDVQE